MVHYLEVVMRESGGFIKLLTDVSYGQFLYKNKKEYENKNTNELMLFSLCVICSFLLKSVCCCCCVEAIPLL